MAILQGDQNTANMAARSAFTLFLPPWRRQVTIGIRKIIQHT